MKHLLKNVIGGYSETKNKIVRTYHTVKIPKRNGKLRTLEIPNCTLSIYQHIIKKYLSESQPCSCYAQAYQKGKKIKNIAQIHTNKKLILKLDIKDFFGHITPDLIKSKLLDCEEGDVLTEICCYNGHLPQGACTSPVISNLVMKDFDNELGDFCLKYNINFSRYSDDMIFSGNFNPGMIIKKVKEMLRILNMELNNKKIIIAGRGSRQMVLGIIVNDKMQLSSDYRRKIRQEVYYCKKYGVSNHILKSNTEKYIKRNTENNIIFIDSIGYIRSLSAKISYALHINPDDSKMAEYRKIICSLWSDLESNKQEPIQLTL